MLRLQPLLLQDPALQGQLRASPLIGPEGAGETVEDPLSDEERATTESESDEEEADEVELSSEELWCPPIPDALNDPFFPVQRRMASARSFNMFQSMLHLGLID